MEYLIEENRVLNEQRKGPALRLNDDQRRRLAAKPKQLGRKALNQVATIVIPDTIKLARCLDRAAGPNHEGAATSFVTLSAGRGLQSAQMLPMALPNAVNRGLDRI